MFDFFKKKIVDKSKVDNFVNWFVSNNERIIESVKNREVDSNTMYAVLDEVESQLYLVYSDGYNGQIEFDYGGDDNGWEINLYHLNDKFLIEAITLIASGINQKLGDLWTVNIDE